MKKIQRNGLYFEVYDDFVKVLGFVKPKQSAKLVIPTYVNKVPVREIAPLAFEYEIIHELRLPSTIQKIGTGAFMGCKELRFVQNVDKLYYEHMSNIVEFDTDVFAGCCNLKYVSIVQDLKIGECAFLNCKKLKNVSNKCVDVGERAFKNCQNLHSLGIEKDGNLMENCLYDSGIKYLYFAGNANLHTSVLNFIKTNDVRLAFLPNSNLSELIYEGVLTL